MRSCNVIAKVSLIEKAHKSVIRKCFWSWPWGHCYHAQLNKTEEVCCYCAKVKYHSMKKC